MRGQEGRHREWPAELLGARPRGLAAGHFRAGQHVLDGVREGRAVVGGADEALTTTGVPQANASSAASPNVSAGPGASTTSALACQAASSARCATWPRKVTGNPSARARWANRRRSGPSPATTRCAATTRRRSAATASRARPGRFSGASREHITRSVVAPLTWRARSAALYQAGWHFSRSTPSGARTRLPTPSRTNSRAAHSVVHTTRAYARAVRRFSRSAA